MAQTQIRSSQVLDASLATADIADDAITYAKLQNCSAASRLLGRGSASGAGDPEEITLSGLTMSGTTLSPTAQAIGSTLTSGTTGSVLFVGAGPVIAQDNSNLFFDNTNKRLGIFTASPLGKLHVGDSSNLNSADTSVLVSRAVSGINALGSGHGLADNSVLSRTDVSYASFDARINITGTTSPNHYNAFQVLSSWGSSGTLSTFSGYTSLPDCTAGIVGNLNHFAAADVSGGGTVNTQRGVYIAELTGGLNNYAIACDGTTPSYFTGNVAIGTGTATEKLRLYGTDVSLLIEGNGVTRAGIKFKSNTAQRWDVNVPSGSTTLTFGSGSTPTTAASLTAGGDLLVNGGANGQSCSIKSLTELTTIAASATTDTTIAIPADCLLVGISVRVTTVIPTATTFNVTATTTATQLSGSTTISTAANTTNAKSRSYENGSSQTIRITPNLVPANNTGRTRITIHYIQVTVPTS